jgi:hypothetical protein
MLPPPFDTPFFAPWRRRFARRAAAAAATVQACTLGELEKRFGACVPDSLFPKAAEKQNSRDRLYTRPRTFWCILWQALQPGASGREVVRQLQALFALHGAPPISQEDGGYFRARARLPEDQFAAALGATARAADQRAASSEGALQGRPLKVVDGSTVVLPDTPKNRAAYPAVHTRPPNFPLMRIVVLFSLCSGAVLALAQGGLRQSELALLTTLLAQLAKGDIVLGDRGFGNYAVVALLQGLGMDFVGRTTRRLDGRRRAQRLGKNDWLFTWAKPREASPWLPLAQWLGLPAQLTVRAVRGQLRCKGFRGREITVVTTLLDPQLYPPEQILRAYLRRWRLEMCLDDLKTTLRLEMLRGRSPAAVRQEAYARLIAHNLVRWTMASAAREQGVELERISFKGTLDGLRQFGAALARARSRRRRAQLWTELLRTLAADLVPARPGRREPRAIKRKKNKYPRLNRPRQHFRDHPKRHAQRTLARRRKLGLM